MREHDLDRLTAAVTTLAAFGIAPDIQELLIGGNPLRDVRPGALAAVLRTPDHRITALEEERDALRDALEPFALLAGGDVNMNDPLRKWFGVHHLQAAAAALTKTTQDKGE